MVVIRAIIVIKEEEMTGISNKVDLLDLTKIDTKRVIDIQEDRLYFKIIKQNVYNMRITEIVNIYASGSLFDKKN